MPQIQHIVLVKLKPDTSDDTVADIYGQLAGLQELIPGIVHFSGGPYTSPEGFNKGFTHAFVMTFSSPEARDAYLPHPEHERIKRVILDSAEDALAFDYEL